MGTSNSKMTNMNCKELEKTLEECCRKKNEDKIKGEAIPKEDNIRTIGIKLNFTCVKVLQYIYTTLRRAMNNRGATCIKLKN